MRAKKHAKDFFARFDTYSYHCCSTVNSEIFARILFSRIALKHIFVMSKISDKGVVYLY